MCHDAINLELFDLPLQHLDIDLKLLDIVEIKQFSGNHIVILLLQNFLRTPLCFQSYLNTLPTSIRLLLPLICLLHSIFDNFKVLL